MDSLGELQDRAPSAAPAIQHRGSLLRNGVLQRAVIIGDDGCHGGTQVPLNLGGGGMMARVVSVGDQADPRVVDR